VPFYLLALAETKTGKYADAVTALRKLVLLQPRNANAFFLLGQNLQKLGRMQEAIVAWKQAADLDPQQTEAMYKAWHAVANTDPELAKSYRDRFKAMQHEKQLTSEAINDCGHCLSRPDLYKDLGLIECKSGNIADGHKDLLTAQSLKPEDPDIAKALELIGTAQLR
jgi:tetratricopeptide (TPR) repeat protein